MALRNRNKRNYNTNNMKNNKSLESNSFAAEHLKYTNRRNLGKPYYEQEIPTFLLFIDRVKRALLVLKKQPTNIRPSLFEKE